MGAALLGAVLGLAMMPAKADLIYEGVVTIGGTGLGAVNTILTMTSHGNGTSESGKVSWNGTTDVVTADPTAVQGGGFTPSGTTDMNGINQTITVGSTGWTPGSGQGLEIIFNPVEPQNAANSIILNNLVMSIYGATSGTDLFDAPWLGGPMTFIANDAGTGNSGFGFALNQAETDELNAAVLGIGVDDHIGLLAYATDATGGHETFFATVVAHDPDPVPEPGTLTLLAVGLASTWLVSRKRRRNNNTGFAAV
jgi:hypothetical protein